METVKTWEQFIEIQVKKHAHKFYDKVQFLKDTKAILSRLTWGKIPLIPGAYTENIVALFVTQYALEATMDAAPTASPNVDPSLKIRVQRSYWDTSSGNFDWKTVFETSDWLHG